MAGPGSSEEAAGSAAPDPHQGLTTGRVCGPCRACCKLPEIPELDKPVNVWCEHVRLDRATGGCGIYADRPKPCREFRCAWLDGLGDEEDRPDRLGVMWQQLPLPGGGTALGFVESRPGALADPRVIAYMDRFAQIKPGLIIQRRAHEPRFRSVELTIDGKAA